MPPGFVLSPLPPRPPAATAGLGGTLSRAVRCPQSPHAAPGGRPWPLTVSPDGAEAAERVSASGAAWRLPTPAATPGPSLWVWAQGTGPRRHTGRKGLPGPASSAACRLPGRPLRWSPEVVPRWSPEGFASPAAPRRLFATRGRHAEIVALCPQSAALTFFFFFFWNVSSNKIPQIKRFVKVLQAVEALPAR